MRSHQEQLFNDFWSYEWLGDRPRRLLDFAISLWLEQCATAVKNSGLSAGQDEEILSQKIHCNLDINPAQECFSEVLYQLSSRSILRSNWRAEGSSDGQIDSKYISRS